jgi:hypothetical protein
MQTKLKHIQSVERYKHHAVKRYKHHAVKRSAKSEKLLLNQVTFKVHLRQNEFNQISNMGYYWF